MPDQVRRAVGTHLRGHAEALLMVSAATFVGLLMVPKWGHTPIVLLYLPPVLGAAILCGRLPAVVAAIGSAMAYNFFFTAPYRTFLIHSPGDMVTVAMLFLVALVTSHLTGSMREQAALASAHAARNATIAGLARRLLSCASEEQIAKVAVDDLARLFRCNAVLIIDRENMRPVASAPRATTLAPGDIAAAALTLDSGDRAGRGITPVSLTDWQFHAVASDRAPIAVVGLARDDGISPIEDDQRPLLRNLLDQVALALERARLEREAREFAASRERDRIRAALLASIGEDVKPRLKAIVSAARELRRSGSADRTVASTLASEAAMLDRYIDNLLDLSPGADRKPVEAGPVTIDLHHRAVHKEGEEVHLTPREYAVLAELAKHIGRVLPHAHLLRTVWGPAQQGQIDYLRVAIRALRLKLEKNPAHPELIINEPAVGYRLAAP